MLRAPWDLLQGPSNLHPPPQRLTTFLREGQETLLPVEQHSLILSRAHRPGLCPRQMLPRSLRLAVVIPS